MTDTFRWIFTLTGKRKPIFILISIFYVSQNINQEYNEKNTGNLCGICGGQSGTGIVYSFYISLLSRLYYSVGVLCLFVHLSPMIYNFSN